MSELYRLKKSALLLPASGDTPAARQAGKHLVRRNQVLRTVRDDGPLSRVEVARRLGFNLRTVSLLVDELVAGGFLFEQESRITSSGRRPIPVAFNPHAACVIGLDIGRSVSAGMIMDIGGNVLSRIEFAPPPPRKPAQQRAWLDKMIMRLLAAYPEKLPPVAGVGISPEGLAYRRSMSHRFYEVADQLQQDIEKTLGVPVFVDGDSHMAALGERWFGCARSFSGTVAVFNITDGLGFTPLVEGRLFSGASGWAGQIGHAQLGEPGIACFCGSTGCLENTASGSGLARLAERARLETNGATPLPSELAAMTGRSAKARDVFEQFAKALATGAAIVIDLFNPEALVLSGRLARLSDVYLDTFTRELEKRTVPFLLSRTQILVSDLHEDAVTLGTCARVLHQIFEPSQVAVSQII